MIEQIARILLLLLLYHIDFQPQAGSWAGLSLKFPENFRQEFLKKLSKESPNKLSEEFQTWLSEKVQKETIGKNS